MVGVSGKSQACNTCRQRRVKCDYGRPSCQRCTTANRTCTGYGRDLVFVNRTTSDLSSTATSVLSDLRAQQKLQDASSTSSVEARLRDAFSKSVQNGHEFRKYAVELLKVSYLPKQSLPSGSNPYIGEGIFSWVYRVADLVEPSKSLDISLYAFCLIQVHLANLGNVLLHQCLEFYNAALQHLYSDLDNPERRFQEETLAAILALSTCELFIRPTEDGWSVHANGIAKILQLRDPKTAGSPGWRYLLTRLGLVCTLEALTKRQARSLERDIWQQVTVETGYDTPWDEVFHIITDIPVILERAAALPLIDDQSILLKESAGAIRSLLSAVHTFESWVDGFMKASSTPQYWLIPSKAKNPADVDVSAKIFPLCFEFTSLRASVPIMMCWSISTQLYSNVLQIYDLVQGRLGCHLELDDILAQADISGVHAAPEVAGHNTVDKTYSIDEIQTAGTEMAHSICQSLEYHHQAVMGTFGDQVTTYPVWSARQYFRLHQGHERELSWLQNSHKMEGPATRWGLATMTFADIGEPLGGWRT